MVKYALIVFPGDIEPLEKSSHSNHPAKLSEVKADGKSFKGSSTNNPTPASHRERMKFARMAAARMGASNPEDESEHTGNPTVGRKGREAGGKAPHSNYSTSVSGMGSQAHSNFNRRTFVVQVGDIGSSAPESVKKYQPKKVRKPKK
jgi:hypothetical protein